MPEITITDTSTKQKWFKFTQARESCNDRLIGQIRVAPGK
jgi:hypothetical protein